MADALDKLREWFLERHEEFGDEVPPPNKIDDAIRGVVQELGATPIKHLGAGDNGIAFLSDDGDIIKFTIDENEAILWNRLKNKSQSGIVQLNDVLNLSSSKTGDSLIFVLKAEYAPKPVTAQQARLIRNALTQAREETRAQLEQMKRTGRQRDYQMIRAGNLVKQFQEVAKVDPTFEEIPMMIADIADRHQGFIYDLQPDNFRINTAGEAVLVDPSVPDLRGDIVRPAKVLYEERLQLVLDSRRIFYE